MGRTADETARVNGLVAELRGLIIETNVPLPRDVTSEDRALARKAYLNVIRATNFVGTAVLGSDSRSVELARLALDEAKNAIRTARSAIARRYS
jgi:hypothetical protein